MMTQELNTSEPTPRQPGSPFVRLSSRWFVGLTIAFILVVTTIPYVYAYLSTPADKQFMGIMLDVPDHAQYFSWMRELSHANLAANKMTPEPNQPIFFNLLWWGLGRLSVLLGVGYPVMFQLLRVLAVVLFAVMAYDICGLFMRDELERRTAFLLICATSGFGWVLVVIKYLSGQEMLFPLDVFIAEGNTFLGMLGYPHFIAAALYVYIFALVLRGQAKKQLRYAVAGGLLALFLGWQHTYDLVSVYAVLAAYALFLLLRDRKLPFYMIWSGLIIGLISSSPAVYSVMLTSLDPIWKAVLAQFDNAGVFTPNLLHLPILLGPAFVLAVYTVIRDNPFRLKGLDDRDLFLKAWFLVTFLVVYLPVDFQIHLLNGWQVAYCILAVSGFFRYVVPLFTRKGRWGWGRFDARSILAAGLILAVLPTNLYLWAWRFIDLSRHAAPYYLYNEEVSGMDWLADHANPDDVVISSLNVGQYIPAMTGTHAYLAHWAQTVDFYTKTGHVNELYAANLTPNERADLLKRERVRYVFWGPSERELGGADIAATIGLTPVYQTDLVTIFEVNR